MSVKSVGGGTRKDPLNRWVSSLQWNGTAKKPWMSKSGDNEDVWYGIWSEGGWCATGWRSESGSRFQWDMATERAAQQKQVGCRQFASTIDMMPSRSISAAYDIDKFRTTTTSVHEWFTVSALLSVSVSAFEHRVLSVYYDCYQNVDRCR